MLQLGCKPFFFWFWIWFQKIGHTWTLFMTEKLVSVILLNFEKKNENSTFGNRPLFRIIFFHWSENFKKSWNINFSKKFQITVDRSTIRTVLPLSNYIFATSPQAFQTVQNWDFLKFIPLSHEQSDLRNNHLIRMSLWNYIVGYIYTCSTTCIAPKLRPLGLKVKPAKHIMAKCVRFVTNTILFKCIFSMRRNRSAYSGTRLHVTTHPIQAASLPKYNCISTVPSEESKTK